jgi:hypothetical protein
MKKLFCTVITDTNGELKMGGPMVFHFRGRDEEQVEKEVKDMLIDEYLPDASFIRYVEIQVFEVDEPSIVELDD